MIARLVMVLAAVMPAMALFFYGIVKTRGDWRNEGLWTALLVGAICVFGTFVVSYPLEAVRPSLALPAAWDAAADALFIAAIPEETAKFLVLVFIALRHADVRREQDTITLALGVSLGFAAMENAVYVLDPGNWASTAAMRALTAVPSHGLDGLLMGALLIRARLSETRKIPGFLWALAAPIGLHAAYDFPILLVRHPGVTGKPVLVLCWLVVFIASAVFVIRLCKKAFGAAAAADKQGDRDCDAALSAYRVSLSGIGLIGIGILLALATFFLTGGRSAWWAAPALILPLVVGGDLIRMGFRQRKRHFTGMAAQNTVADADPV